MPAVVFSCVSPFPFVVPFSRSRWVGFYKERLSVLWALHSVVSGWGV